jgi:PTH2 family peptidyl-tRNA hydrolase
MKQVIIARKDLGMSPGKLAAQVSHGSMAFLTNIIKNHTFNNPYQTIMSWSTPEEIDIYENWINGSFTKVICEAKNKNQLMKAVKIAEELGLKEDKDFFLIKDNCLTELEPEEDGRTLTVIGFRPLDDETASAISKKFQLYKG